jgi:hypothetical protein
MIETRSSGRPEESFGHPARDGKPEGTRREMKAQDLRGRPGGAAERPVRSAPKGSDDLDDTVRRYVETKPYTTALIALGVGWLLGRSHHPF